MSAVWLLLARSRQSKNPNKANCVAAKSNSSLEGSREYRDLNCHDSELYERDADHAGIQGRNEHWIVPVERLGRFRIETGVGMEIPYEACSGEGARSGARWVELPGRRTACGS